MTTKTPLPVIRKKAVALAVDLLKNDFQTERADLKPLCERLAPFKDKLKGLDLSQASGLINNGARASGYKVGDGSEDEEVVRCLDMTASKLEAMARTYGFL